MAQILAKYTAMPVQRVEDATPIKSNHVYMIPPKKLIRIQDGGLFLKEPTTNRGGIRLPIDYSFHCLAVARRDRPGFSERGPGAAPTRQAERGAGQSPGPRVRDR